MHYAPHQKPQLVKFYLETKSVILAQRNCKRLFETRIISSRNVIFSLTEKFLATTGSLENQERGKYRA